MDGITENTCVKDIQNMLFEKIWPNKITEIM